MHVPSYVLPLPANSFYFACAGGGVRVESWNLHAINTHSTTDPILSLLPKYHMLHTSSYEMGSCVWKQVGIILYHLVLPHLYSEEQKNTQFQTNLNEFE